VVRQSHDLSNRTEINVVQAITDSTNFCDVTFSSRTTSSEDDSATDWMISVDERRLHQVLVTLFSTGFSSRALTLELESLQSSIQCRIIDKIHALAPVEFATYFESFRPKVGLNFGAATDATSIVSRCMTKAIIEAHDGTIAVLNTPDSGSMVQMRLPKCAATKPVVG
jgi:K+-sensing histidine kinase KdpD